MRLDDGHDVGAHLAIDADVGPRRDGDFVAAPGLAAVLVNGGVFEAAADGDALRCGFLDLHAVH